MNNSSFTFNKAPINKTDAKAEINEERVKPKKRSAFMANLYADNDDIDEMKVLTGDQFENPEDDMEQGKSKKAREAKATLKGTTGLSAQPVSASKIGRLVSNKS